jgi:hypothetical protein
VAPLPPPEPPPQPAMLKTAMAAQISFNMTDLPVG